MSSRKSAHDPVVNPTDFVASLVPGWYGPARELPMMVAASAFPHSNNTKDANSVLFMNPSCGFLDRPSHVPRLFEQHLAWISTENRSPKREPGFRRVD